MRLRVLHWDKNFHLSRVYWNGNFYPDAERVISMHSRNPTHFLVTTLRYDWTAQSLARMVCFPEMRITIVFTLACCCMLVMMKFFMQAIHTKYWHNSFWNIYLQPKAFFILPVKRNKKKIVNLSSNYNGKSNFNLLGCQFLLC